jgi:hypothetical protein
MKALHGVACAAVVMSASVCVADVVRYSGPYVWYRSCGGSNPPAALYFNVTQPANMQPVTGMSPNDMWYSLCGGLTSCGLFPQSIIAAGIQRSSASVPVSRCTSTLDVHLAHALVEGDIVGPAAVPGATWQTSADVGASVGASGQLMLTFPRYIGVRVLLNGEWHYGWAYLESTVNQAPGYLGFVVTEWAYESTPNTPIVVGNPACDCEFDGTAGITSQDFFDFITAFFNLSASADVNHDGSITSQDYFDFLTCFFVPPPACN